MQRKFFCGSIAILALLPTLVAFYDDDSYEYIEDVSFQIFDQPVFKFYSRMILMNQPFQQHLNKSHPLKPQPLTRIAIVVSTHQVQNREGVKVERE